MAEPLSLKELKAENEADVAKNVKPTEDEYIEIDPETEEPIEAKAEEGDEEEEEIEDSETEELEAWQQTEEDSEDNKPVIDGSGWKKQRLKTKALKAEISDKDSKLEALEAKVAALTNPQVTPTDLKRPTRDQYDYDDNKFDEAMDEYYEKKLDQRLSTHTQTTQQVQAQQAAITKQKEIVEGHYDRAAKLINDGKIKEEAFRNGDQLIRNTLDLVVPGRGDVLADQLISILSQAGEGSEKTWHYVGANAAPLNTLRDKLIADPSGFLAVSYLSGIQKEFSKPTRKRKSEAPAPAQQLKGDAPKAAGKAQKHYKKLTDPGERVRFKRKQKKAGVDVSKW